MWACDSCAPIENVGSRKLRTLQGQAKGQPQRVIHDDSAPSSVMATLPPSCCRRAATSMRAAFLPIRSAMASGLAVVLGSGYRVSKAAFISARGVLARLADCCWPSSICLRRSCNWCRADGLATMARSWPARLVFPW